MVDVTAIVSTAATVVILGLALYGQYKSNLKQHKSTQGGVATLQNNLSAAAKTVADNTGMVNSLKEDVTKLATELAALKGGN